MIKQIFFHLREIVLGRRALALGRDEGQGVGTLAPDHATNQRRESVKPALARGKETIFMAALFLCGRAAGKESNNSGARERIVPRFQRAHEFPV